LPPRPRSSLASGACPMGTTTRLSDLWVQLCSFRTVWVSYYCLYVRFSLFVHCRVGFSWVVLEDRLRKVTLQDVFFHLLVFVFEGFHVGCLGTGPGMGFCCLRT